MPDPFRLQGPSAINVSGGRTSGMMLHHILERHDGRLPPDVFAFFCNTGREMPATLDFVRDMSVHWSVHIQWLEYRRDPETGRQWAEAVSHNSASRNGEPFVQLLEARGYMLPGPKMRFCTEELKMRTVQRWVRDELGWGWHRRYLGLRYDELHRVHRIALRNASRRDGHFGSCPLAKARMTKLGHVKPFWAAQPFDLGLAGDWEGNCDGCFLKRQGSLVRMTIDHPDKMLWWSEQERLAKARGYTNGQFRSPDRESYAQIADRIRREPTLPGLYLDPDDTGFDAFADCEGGCGV
jgi:3'-phosphoadenosine 5'-phosphosulfate sulfotransferase (PAPS reductase)/FAD synthetase